MKIEETLTRMSHPLVLFFISNKHVCIGDEHFKCTIDKIYDPKAAR